jgi:hypothetical protein
MSQREDPDARDSELDPRNRPVRAARATHGQNIRLELPAGLGNGNFKWLVIFLLGLMASTYGYLWVTKDQRDEKHDEKKEERISTLEQWRARADERMDWMQREIEQTRKQP